MKISFKCFVVLVCCSLIVGFLAGMTYVKARDYRKERMNYLGRKCMESIALMSDISDLNSNETNELDARLNARLDTSAIIVYSFINDDKIGIQAQRMLNSIYNFRLKHPHESQAKEIKFRLESALAVGKNFGGQSGGLPRGEANSKRK